MKKVATLLIVLLMIGSLFGVTVTAIEIPTAEDLTDMEIEPVDESMPDGAYGAINPSYRTSDSPYLRLPIDMKDWPPIVPPEPREIEGMEDPSAVEIYNTATGEVILIPSNDTTQQPVESGLNPTLSYQGLLPPGIVPESVFPPDDRVRVTSTNTYPWRTVCRLFITAADGTQWMCSGAIIGCPDGHGYHVLTAGHCVYLHDHGGWATSVKIVPGLDDDYMPYNYAWKTNTRSYTGWTVYQDHRYDWAVLTLDRNVGDYTGWMGRQTASSSSSIYTGILNTAGYPSDKGGLTMWFDADYGRTANEYNHWYYMDTYGGQSGSPVWRYDGSSRYILTIHAYGDDGSGSNHGTRLNQDKYDRIITWCNEDTSPTDKADLIDEGQSYSGFNPTTVSSGDSFHIWCDVRNVGTASSGGFYVSYYASTNTVITEYDYLICTDYVSSISPFNYRDSDWSGTFPSIPDGTYYVGWIIDSGDDVTEFDKNNNVAYKDSYQLVVTPTVPGSPTLISPPDGSTITTTTPTFTWNSVSTADYYGLYISEPPYGPSHLVFDSEEDYGPIYGSSFTSLPSGILEDGVTYYWNMRAHNSAGWGGFSDSWHFTVDIPEIELTPSNYNFGSIDIGQCSSEYSFTLTNTGGGTATGSVSLTGTHASQFTITQGSGSFSLGAGASKTIKVKFCPASTGSKSATLYADGSNCNDDSSSLSGTGTQPPSIDLSPSSHSFGNVEVGSCSSEYSFTLTNTGGGTATGSVSLTGTHASQFTITSGSGSFSLGAGASKTIKVKFCPTSTGSKSATLYADGSNCNDDSSSLSGTGTQPPSIDLSPSSHNFGNIEVGSCSSEYSFTLTNTGGGTATGTVSRTGTHASQFTITQGSGSFSLGAGASKTIKVKFCPTSTGSKSATLYADGSNCNDDTSSLSGTGTQPPSIDFSPSSYNFGSVEVGSCSSEFSFTLTNTGGGTATGSVSKTGTHASQFTITQGSGSFSLGAGASKTIKVKFCPTSTGSKSAILYADGSNCNDDSSSLSGTGYTIGPIELTPPSHPFGDVQVGECSSGYSFTLTNTGGGTATGSVSLTGTHASQFTITQGAGSFSLGAGASKTIKVKFCPASTGAKSATLYADGTNCNDDSSSLSGTGTPPQRTITFYTDPTDGGTITFDGSTYSNGQSTTKTDGTYSVSANPASNYVFNHWPTTGGVSVSNPNSQSTTATVSGDGSIKAWFNYIQPQRTITFYTDPNDGGTITFDGSTYSNGASTTKTDGTYSVSANPASNYEFDHWSTTGGVSVANPDSQSATATVSGDGSIKAWFNYVPPQIVTYTITNRTITPPQTTEIDVEFSEEVAWRIAIEGSSVIYDWSGTSTNPTPKTWDGTYEVNGTVVPAGDYYVNVTGTSTTTGLSVINNTGIITVTTSDITPPTIVSVTLNKSEVYASEPINVTVIAEDNVGVVSVTAKSFTATWNSDETSLSLTSGTAKSGIWTGTITAPFTAGTYNVSIVAKDDAGNTATNGSALYKVSGGNKPPIANFSYSPQNLVVNQTITFDASNSTDPDGTIVKYEWDFGDGNITNTTEEIITHSYTSADNYTAILTVTDNASATNTTTKLMTVYPLTCPTANPVRDMPGSVNPGGDFNVTVTWTAPANEFNSIGLTDNANATANMTVSGNTGWCTPNANIVTPVNNIIEYAWYYDPYSSGTSFTALYSVHVPTDAPEGNYTFDGNLLYYIAGEGPFTEDIAGDSAIRVIKAKANPVRDMPESVNPGEDFNVTINWTAPADAFNAIGLTDNANATANMTVSGNTGWCTPNADNVKPENNTIEYLWYGPYSKGTDFTAVYSVHVPIDVPEGNYAFDGHLEYYIGREGPFIEDIAGDSIIKVIKGIPISGTTGEVNCSIEPNVVITLYNKTTGDKIAETTSDTNGNYTLTAPCSGDYNVTASKEGFKNVTREISITEEVTSFNFRGEYGLTPEDPSMGYALECVNHWLYPELQPEECRLSMSKALEVVNAWLY